MLNLMKVQSGNIYGISIALYEANPIKHIN